LTYQIQLAAILAPGAIGYEDDEYVIECQKEKGKSKKVK